MKRRFLTTAAAIVSASLVATILADSAAAQWQQIQSYQQQQRDQRRRQRDAAAQRQIDALTLKLSGVIEALAPGRIQMVTDAGEAWLLQVMSQADVEVTGTATPEFLAPGQFVSFVAQVDTRHSKIDAQVGSLTIFTPDQEHMLGAFPEGPAGAGPGQPGPGGDQPAAVQPPPDARAARAALPDLQTFEIAGRITRLRNGEMMVAIPSVRAPVRVQLAEQLQIDVHLSGTNAYGWAKKGDKIEMAGIQSPTGDRLAQAVKITINMAQPLGATEQRKPLRRPVRLRGKDAEQQAPAETPQAPADAPAAPAQ